MRSVGVRDKVAKAAIALFAEKGVEGVSIGDIAAAAGVSQGALYRHYRGKGDLARTLFSTAYRRIGAELDAIRGREPNLAARIGAMVGHFCALYDADPALFRFLLLAQHDFLPQLGDGESEPPAVIARTVAEAAAAGEIAAVEPALGAAVIMGVVLQAATFHLYGRIGGELTADANALARAAVAALNVLDRAPERRP